MAQRIWSNIMIRGSYNYQREIMPGSSKGRIVPLSHGKNNIINANKGNHGRLHVGNPEQGNPSSKKTTHCMMMPICMKTAKRMTLGLVGWGNSCYKSIRRSHSQSGVQKRDQEGNRTCWGKLLFYIRDKGHASKAGTIYRMQVPKLSPGQSQYYGQASHLWNRTVPDQVGPVDSAGPYLRYHFCCRFVLWLQLLRSSMGLPTWPLIDLLFLKVWSCQLAEASKRAKAMSWEWPLATYEVQALEFTSAAEMYTRYFIFSMLFRYTFLIFIALATVTFCTTTHGISFNF